MDKVLRSDNKSNANTLDDKRSTIEASWSRRNQQVEKENPKKKKTKIQQKLLQFSHSFEGWRTGSSGRYQRFGEPNLPRDSQKCRR